VHDLEIEGGTITARVTGTRPVPYQVTIQLTPLADRVWTAAIRAMASRAVFAARLLSGEMPQEIDEAFHGARASLFPQRVGDLSTACTCPDWANPCKHVAAVHYVLADAFDRDPFLLFELRGRRRGLVLAALRRLRAAGKPSSPRSPATTPRAGKPTRGAVGLGRDPTTVALTGLSAQQYESFRGNTDDLRFHIGTPAAAGAVLRQLGTPPGWSLRASPADLLYPAVARAAAQARDLALGSPLPPQGTTARRPAGTVK
jgi:uncharacterized Zn finger protein